MAHVVTPNQNALRMGKGWMTDLVANVTDICMEGFANVEELQAFAPKDNYCYAPDVGPVYALPSLHVWVNRVTYDTPALGQQTPGVKFRTHQLAFVNIQYIHSSNTSHESRVELMQVASFLTEHLRRNLNLNGLVNGGNIHEVLVIDKHYSVKNLLLAQTAIIHAAYSREMVDYTSTVPI